MSIKKYLAGAAALSLVPVAAQLVPASAQTVKLDTGLTVGGQGSTFMSNFVEQCKADVKNAFNINIGYQPTGSGAGRSGFIAGTLDFAGSDVPFTTSELQRLTDKKFVYIPITIGGIAIVYKLGNVTDLKLSATTLAKIFSGSVQKWNDSAIAADNPGTSLPDSVIKVVVRSDSSGTSTVFTDYLASASKGAWTKGVTGTFPVPAGNGIAQRGSDGVTNYVASASGEGSITYSEVSFATERKLGVAKVINTAGNPVTPEPANVSEAMASAAVNDDGTLLLNYNAPGAKAYPISTTAYLIAPQTIDAAKGDVLRTFLTHSIGECQKKAEKIGYAPLPQSLVTLSQKEIDKINPGSGSVPTIPGAAAATPTTAAAAPTTAAATTAPATTKATATTKKAATKTTKKSTKTTKKK